MTNEKLNGFIDSDSVTGVVEIITKTPMAEGDKWEVEENGVKEELPVYLACKEKWNILNALVLEKYNLTSLKKAPANFFDTASEELMKTLGELKVLPITVTMSVDTVYVSYGMTLNIGNYESFRADAGVTIKQKHGLATSSEMYKEGWEIVQTQLREQIVAVRAKTKDSQNGKQ